MKLIVFFALLALGVPYTLEGYTVGGWVPYWTALAGTQKAEYYLNKLDQISPFAYEVQNDGSIKDPFKKEHTTWNSLAKACRDKQKLLIPTVAWHSTLGLKSLSNKDKRTDHINKLIALVQDNHLAGINLNYENISSKDREGFILLIEELSEKLHAQDRLLHLTIGARTSDARIGYQSNPSKMEAQSVIHSMNQSVNVSLNPGTGADAKRYKEVIARCCDQIVIMGYDEWRLTLNKDGSYHIAHCSNQWLEQAITYALSYLPPEKLVLGVPTYGIEFIVTRTSSGIRYKKKRSWLHEAAVEFMKKKKLHPQRAPGGEMYVRYEENEQERYIVFVDSITIQKKIKLTQKYDLKGIYFFALYGQEDNLIWKQLAAHE